jgi:hypothetical protein
VASSGLMTKRLIAGLIVCQPIFLDTIYRFKRYMNVLASFPNDQSPKKLSPACCTAFSSNQWGGDMPVADGDWLSWTRKRRPQPAGLGVVLLGSAVLSKCERLRGDLEGAQARRVVENLAGDHQLVRAGAFHEIA